MNMTKYVKIGLNFWAGKIPSNPVVEHTAYAAGNAIKNRWKGNNKISVLNYKPAHALATAHDDGFMKNLFVIHNKSDEIVGYVGMYGNKSRSNALAQECFTLLTFETDGTPHLVTNAPYSRCGYYPVLAYMLKTDEEAIRVYRKLCNNLKWDDPKAANCFFEKNKQAAFEIMADGLYQKMNEFFPISCERVENIYDSDQNKIKEFLNEGWLEDVTGWVHLDCKDQEGLTTYAKNLGVFQDEVDIRKTEMPIVSISEKTQALSKENMEEFLQKDWTIMSDDEAAKLPQFLQIQRKAMRNYYESKKATLSYEVALKIKEMHDGKLKTLSLSGPAGTGKTFAARMIAGALNLPLQIVVGKAGVDSSEYLGSYQIVSKNGETNSVWKDGAIAEVVRYGGILLFDEINLAEPEVVGSLNTLLDISNCLCLSNGETLPAHEKFFYIEAMNIGSGFDGTNKMNNSHRRRMQRKMRFALPSKEEETAILMDTTGYKKKEILARLVEVEKYIRKNIQDPTNQYISISEVQGWIGEAEYTGEWVQSACDTILAPLMEQDESYEDYSIETIGNCGGFAQEVLEYIQDLLGEETY